MIRLVLVFGQIVDDSPLGLGRDDRCGEQQCDSQYFQCFFQDANGIKRMINEVRPLLLHGNGGKIRKKSNMLYCLSAQYKVAMPNVSG